MLGLYILKMALRYQQEGRVSLVWIMKEKRIPRATFYRAVNHIIQQGFMSRVGRDRYELHVRY